MFKAVFSNNKMILAKLVEAILNYYKVDIDIKGKDIIIRNNELPLNNYKDRELICDYIIKIDDDTDLNIEINRSNYIGLVERNLTYSFKIFYEHFKAGDNYKEFNKYTLFQVNFNNYTNYNRKSINRYYIINVDDFRDKLTNNFNIMNIDIAKCYDLVYNNNNLEEISDLEKWSAIIYCKYLEDINSILESGLLSMLEREKFLNDIKEKAKDKDVISGIKFEDSLDYRFEMVREDAYERGTINGIEQTKLDVIKSMLGKNMTYQDISDISGKSIQEIKKIEESIKK